MSLILFDFDGVLADTLADMLRFAQEVCDELGVKHTVVQTDLSELEVMSFATFGRACETPEDLVDEFVRRCTGKFAEKKSPPAIFDGLGEVVRKLAESACACSGDGEYGGECPRVFGGTRAGGLFPRGVWSGYARVEGGENFDGEESIRSGG